MIPWVYWLQVCYVEPVLRCCCCWRFLRTFDRERRSIPVVKNCLVLVLFLVQAYINVYIRSAAIISIFKFSICLINYVMKSLKNVIMIKFVKMPQCKRSSTAQKLQSQSLMNETTIFSYVSKFKTVGFFEGVGCQKSGCFSFMIYSRSSI